MWIPNWQGSCGNEGTWHTTGYMLESLTFVVSLSQFQSRIFHLLVTRGLCIFTSLLLRFLIYRPVGNNSSACLMRLRG